MAWHSRPQGATRGVASPDVGRRSAGVRAVDLGVSSAAHDVPKPARTERYRRRGCRAHDRRVLRLRTQVPLGGLGVLGGVMTPNWRAASWSARAITS